MIFEPPGTPFRNHLASKLTPKSNPEPPWDPGTPQLTPQAAPRPSQGRVWTPVLYEISIRLQRVLEPVLHICLTYFVKSFVVVPGQTLTGKNWRELLPTCYWKNIARASSQKLLVKIGAHFVPGENWRELRPNTLARTRMPKQGG